MANADQTTICANAIYRDKSGTEFRVLLIGVMAGTGDPVVAYRRVHHGEKAVQREEAETPAVMTLAEFIDGRFTDLPNPWDEPAIQQKP